MNSSSSANLTVLVRTLPQLQCVLQWTPPDLLPRPALIYCDFEDFRLYADAVSLARSANKPIALCTPRIIKPAEENLLKQIADAAPDAVLVRNLAGLLYFCQTHPHLPLIGDYSLNIANELTAQFLIDQGLLRIVPSYDLNWPQLQAMLSRYPAARFEVVIHQHMPMFHMEHCVFCHTLSSGKDHRDCRRPCEHHTLQLSDRAGVAHPVLADAACRNTVFNAAAQSAAEFVPQMKQLGVTHFRLELLLEDSTQAHSLLDSYARVLAGLEDGPTACRRLRALNQLGVTRGTLDFA